MPYASNAELPSEVRDALPEAAQSVFRRVVTEEENKGKSESQAFATAWTAVKNGWHKNDKDEWVRKVADVELFKTNDELRLVFGFASVIEKDGQEVTDTQNDVIETTELLRSTTAYMEKSREAKMMHAGGKIGEVVHSFPLTADIAKSLGISTPQYGWIVGMRVDNDSVWDMVKNGELQSFSIGGRATRVPMGEIE